MKIELTDADKKEIAEIVADNIRTGIIKSAANTAHYEAMVEKGKEMAMRLYGDMSTNEGVHEVVGRKVKDVCREELRNVIKSELEKIIGSNEHMQRMLFRYLLEGVVEKAQGLAYKVNHGTNEDD